MVPFLPNPVRATDANPITRNKTRKGADPKSFGGRGCSFELG